MDRRDYIIIFCLLLPFFITLPLYLMKRADYNAQAEQLELTRDSLFLYQYRLGKLGGEEPLVEPEAAAAVAVTTEEQTAAEEPTVATEQPVAAPAPEPAAPQPTVAVTPTPAPRREVTPSPASPAPAPPAVRAAPTPAPVPEEEETTKLSPPNPVITRARALAATPAMREQLADVGPVGIRPGNAGLNITQTFDTTGAVISNTLQFSCTLRGVSEELYGRRKVYLVITDAASQVPVAGLDNVRGKVKLNGIALDLYAAAARTFTFSAPTQQISFQRGMNKELPAGKYLVEVISEGEMLGNFLFEVEDLVGAVSRK